MNQDPLFVSNDIQSDKKQLILQILSDFKHKYQLDLSQDPVALERISEAVDQAFQHLETSSTAEIDLPYISANSAGPIHIRRIIKRTDLTNFPGKLELGGERNDGEQETSPQQVNIQLPDKKPYLTIVLLVIMAVLYGLQQLTDLVFGIDLLAVYGMKSNELIINGEYWRLVTPIFLHGSILHLGFNLYALNILGRRVERYFGHIRFLGLFMIAGITGNLFSFVFTQAPSLGSSTAIFGLLGAEGIFIYQHQKLFGQQFKTALRQIVQVAVGNLVIGFLVPGIDNWGHIGGLIGGGIYSGLSGPLFRISGSPPDLHLENVRSNRSVGFWFFIQLVLLVIVSYVILAVRS